MKKKMAASVSDLEPEDFPQGNSQPSNLDVDLEPVDLPLINEEEQKKLQANTQAVRVFVEEHLRKIDASRASVREVNIDPENKKKVQEAVQKIWKRINDLLNRHKEAAYRMAAWVSLLTYMFKAVNPRDFYEAMSHLDWMVKNKYLIEVEDPVKEKASLRAWKRGFRVPEHACFGRQEFEEVQKALADMVTRTVTKTVARRDARAKELQEEATLEAKETFEEGSDGTSFLYIPPQIALKERQVHLYHGGYMLVDVKENGRIYPIEGVGSFESKLQEAYTSEVYVQAFTLDWDRPFGRKKLEAFGWDKEQGDGYYTFWNLLKRAKNRLQKDNQYKEEKLVMAREGVEVSEEAFFLERQEGTTLVDLEGAWESWVTQEDGKKIKEETTDIFLLVKRQGVKIKIVGCPKHLETFFSGCTDSYNEGEKFTGVPQPLQAVLQAQYGACQTKALIA